MTENRRRSRPDQRNASRARQSRQSGSRPRAQRARRQTRPKSPLPLALIVLAVMAVAFAAFKLTQCGNTATPDGNPQGSKQTESTSQENTVSFVAVGDNIPELILGEYADACAGGEGDGTYDFKPLYSHVKDTIESADLSCVTEEVHLGGDDIGPQDYPTFNVPDAVAEALVDTGFDLCATASNHSLDWGLEALVNSRNTLGKTSMAIAGTAVDEEQASQIATVERNGVTFAFLDYDYAVNGMDWSDVPSYCIKPLDEDIVTQEVTEAKRKADVVIVAAHWGTEYRYEPDSMQEEFAQLFADLGVDIVIGSHPHVIGPVEWLAGKNGNRTLVAYSLGNFVSHHDSPILDNQLEGMLSCDFVRQDDGKVAIENIVWTPLVMHDEENAYAVYKLKDYTDELASHHRGLAELDDPIGQMRQLTVGTVGTDITIDD